jgi:hypothetical protein
MENTLEEIIIELKKLSKHFHTLEGNFAIQSAIDIVERKIPIRNSRIANQKN